MQFYIFTDIHFSSSQSFSAFHAVPGSNLALPQRALLNVLLILSVAISFAAFIAFRLGRFCCSQCRRKKFPVETKKKN